MHSVFDGKPFIKNSNARRFPIVSTVISWYVSLVVVLPEIADFGLSVTHVQTN